MKSPQREHWLAALPVYNEVSSVCDVLKEVSQYIRNVLVVDDGSTDGTRERLSEQKEIHVVRHTKNLGYGAALRTAFHYAIEEGYDGVVTLDCDGQHQPKRIPRFIEAARTADIVSGSRYLKRYTDDNEAPAQRLFINRQITTQLNRRLGLNLTDAFCGFKAYQTEALKRLRVTDSGYAMPLQLWVEAAANDLRVIEIPVPRIYLDLERSFGGALDDAETRLGYYNQIIDDAIESSTRAGKLLPKRTLCQHTSG